MSRLRILTWHVHGSYLRALAQLPHDFFLPVKPDRPEGYGGRFADLPSNVLDVAAEDVRHLDLDLVLYQSAKNYLEDGPEILSDDQQRVPKIFLEHNAPRPHPTDSRHPVDDPDVLLVHVTHYNRLMWDCGRTPTEVVQHSVVVDPALGYTGDLPRGISVVNDITRRNRITGLDVYLQAANKVPLDIAGMNSDEIGGLGDIPYGQLHARMARYRFLFSPIRYTSMPLAVVEAMTIGLPVVALATTELPSVIQNGVNGYISCSPDELIERMLFLLDNPAEARRLGQNARATALERFGLQRFIRDWDRIFRHVTERRPATV